MIHEPECRFNDGKGRDAKFKTCFDCQRLRAAYQRGREAAAKAVGIFAMTPRPHMETADWLDGLDAAARGENRHE